MKTKKKKKLVKMVMSMVEQFKYMNTEVYQHLSKVEQAIAEICEHVGLDVNDDRRILKPTRQPAQASYKPVPPDAH